MILFFLLLFLKILENSDEIALMEMNLFLAINHILAINYA